MDGESFEKATEIILMRAEHIRDVFDIALKSNLFNHSIESFKNLLNNKNYYNLVLIKDKKISGYLISRLIINDAAIDQINQENSKYNTKSEAELHEIAVLKNLQNQKAGTWLIRTLINKCINSKIQRIWVELRKSNYKALNFYQKHDFELIYTRKNYYTEFSEDALVMKLDLSPKYQIMQT